MPPTHIATPTRIEAAGTPPKLIQEYVGHVNTGTGATSVALMTSPAGWEEPGQTPEFDEYTLVLDGAIEVRSQGGVLTVAAGEAVVAHAGEWVQYATPTGAKYVAVCLPAFTPETVHRDNP